MRRAPETQSSEPRTDQSTQSPPYDCEGRSSLQWPIPPRYHVDGNRGLGDRDAELEQFAVYLGSAPQRVLKTHSSDQLAHLSLPKTRFEHSDGVVRQGPDTRQCRRAVRPA